MRSAVLQRLAAIVREAGAVVESHRQTGFSVREKEGMGPVTTADRAADRFLRRELTSLLPCGWLSEETADRPSRVHAECVWVVDPIDGTKEFVRGQPEYAVSVALAERGQPVLASVYNPVTQELFQAERGQGATLNDGAISVAESRVVLGSRSELRRGEFDAFDEEWEVTPLGSIAYKLALVAAGRAGVTLSRGPKWEWDVCAGALLVEESGGRASDVFGSPLVFNKEIPKVAGILAGAPEAAARAQEAVDRIGPSARMQELEEDAR